MSETRDAPHGPGPLQGLRVLVAEDNALTADHIGLILIEEGARLIGPCSTVAEARRVLNQQSVEFVLVDLNLSDSFADELIEDSRRLNIPFAIITGYQALPTNAYDGAEEVLLKPVQRRTLIEMLARFL
jgi:two-component SAPR family response regulator